MATVITRITLVLFSFILINPSLLPATAEQRIALVIGNSTYSSGPLKNPVNDATDMAAMLKKLGFIVTLKKNARLQEMDEAIEELGNRLKRGGVGLFYYSGHGVQVNGVNYLLPIGAKINKDADVKYQAVDANRILDEMATANNGLNIVILDACRDNPFARSFRNAARGLAIVSTAPAGTFISYSTSPGSVAQDGEGRNSPYTAALIKYIQVPGLSISDVFINVRTKVKKETGQVPWELSSLEGQFYFVPGSARKSVDSVPSGKAAVQRDKLSVSISGTDILDDESGKLEAEQRRLADERRSLEEEREALKREKEMVAKAVPPSSISAPGLFGTAVEAKTLMKKAVTYLKANGKDKAYEAFNNKSDFWNKDLYIFVLDLDGKILSHGANDKLIGRNMMAIKDKKGQLFIKKIVDLANTKGKGEVEYYWDNPVTKQLAPKVSILEKVGDVIVACTYYK